PRPEGVVGARRRLRARQGALRARLRAGPPARLGGDPAARPPPVGAGRGLMAVAPTLGEVDLHLFGEGRHERLWTVMGAHGRDGAVSFAVWAPNARQVSVVGDFNDWDGDADPMRTLGSSGVWEAVVAGVESGARYKYQLVTADGRVVQKADPFAFAADVTPGTSSVVTV